MIRFGWCGEAGDGFLERGVLRVTILPRQEQARLAADDVSNVHETNSCLTLRASTAVTTNNNSSRLAVRLCFYSCAQLPTTLPATAPARELLAFRLPPLELQAPRHLGFYDAAQSHPPSHDSKPIYLDEQPHAHSANICTPSTSDLRLRDEVHDGTAMLGRMASHDSGVTFDADRLSAGGT